MTRRIRTAISLITAAILWIPIVAAAQEEPGLFKLDPLGSPVTVKTYTSLSSVPQGGTVNAALVLEISGLWHVNANKVNEEFLIPTVVEFTPPKGMTLKGVVYPDGVEKTLEFSETPMRLYEKEAVIGAVFEASADMPVGDVRIAARVTYQACDNEKCLAPVTEDISIPVRISPPTEAIDFAHADIFEKVDFAAMTDAGMSSGSGRLGSIIAQRGFIFAFLMVYVWGLALNLTPCVYPIIPITVSYFGGQASGRTGQTLMLAAVYVLGMATMYSVLGLVAALTGGLLGTALQNPFVVVFVALVLVALAFSMFGYYEIRVPTRLSNLAGASSGKQGPVGAYLMGLTVGIVAAPCIGPLVLALLTFVGESANPALGFSMFFTLALGLGTPFLLLGVLSGSITKLPKSGEWMDWIKRLFGVVLIAMAVFFLGPLMTDPVYWALMGAVFVIGGALLGFIKTQVASTPFNLFKRFVGIAAPLFGVYLILAPGHIIARGDVGGIVWDSFDDALLAEATANEQYVLIDFSADWCLPCKELDHKTFSPDEVVEATSGFVNLKADLTKSASKEVTKIREDFEIRGVPTVVFIDKNGKERTDLRVFGFVDKTDFLERVNKLKSGT